MTPAIECRGCNRQWKTAHQPATKTEMEKLIEAVATHKAQDFATALKYARVGDKLPHGVTVVYHAITPEKGFENAEVINEA